MKKALAFTAVIFLLIFNSCTVTDLSIGQKIKDSQDDTSAPVPGTVPEPGEINAVFQINTGLNIKDISPYIYGKNYFDADSFSLAPYTLGRLGGNRWSAYNWENNASNAGSDWYFHNDGYLGGGDVPGAAVTNDVTAMFNSEAAALITVPILGYAAADKAGTDVRDTANYLTARFNYCSPVKGGSFSLIPNLADDYVYQDEFVNLIDKTFPDAKNASFKKIFYSLDNEPDLWSDTHSAIHPSPVTYNELTALNINYAKAVKSVIPNALVFGFVSYGFNGFYNLQNSDADYALYGEFIDYYLTKMKQAEQTNGYRVIDVLDLHWYPEAYGGGVRITNDNNSAATAAARMQAPRSLWDNTYAEDSWIADFYGGSVQLLKRIQDKIDNNYPGTKIAVTEYYYGGGDHISGAIAQADVLGIFAKEGIFAATLWHLGDTDDRFINAAFKMFLNYDGAGSKFGDKTVSVTGGNNAETSIYAGINGNNPDRIVLIAINKTANTVNAQFNLTVSGGAFTNYEVYELKGTSAVPVHYNNTALTGSSFTRALPPYSVSAIVLTR